MKAGAQAPGRRMALGLGLRVGLAALFGPIALAQGPSEPLTIQLVARKFMFTPEQVPVKVGQSLLLELTTLDFAHGFGLPDLKLRTDLVPGQVVKLALQFDKPGDYVFLCDNYCGDGHEDMFGRFLVTG